MSDEMESYYKEELRQANANLKIEKDARERAEALLRCAIRHLKGFDPKSDWQEILEEGVRNKNDEMSTLRQ